MPASQEVSGARLGIKEGGGTPAVAHLGLVVGWGGAGPLTPDPKLVAYRYQGAIRGLVLSSGLECREDSVPKCTSDRQPYPIPKQTAADQSKSKRYVTSKRRRADVDSLT